MIRERSPQLTFRCPWRLIRMVRFGSVPVVNHTSHRQADPQVSARSLARFIILSRSNASAFLLSSSSSGGIALNAASIAISFASARFTFISRNSCSILSNVWSDKSFSNMAIRRHYSCSAS